MVKLVRIIAKVSAGKYAPLYCNAKSSNVSPIIEPSERDVLACYVLLETNRDPGIRM